MKACIFDLDGTLTNTLESLVYSVRATLREMGLPEITKEQCRTFVGNGARRLMVDSLAAVGDENAERLEEGMQVYGRIFDENCTYHVTPYEGIVKMLEALKDRGIKLAVLSNKPHAQTVKVVREIFGDGVFDYVSRAAGRNQEKTRAGWCMAYSGGTGCRGIGMSVCGRF